MDFATSPIGRRAVQLLGFGVLAIGLAGQAAVAQTPVPTPDPDKAVDDSGRLTPGVIASQGSFPKNKSVNVAGDSAPGDAPSPVMARVVRKSAEQCEAVLTNSSKESGYSVSFEVVGTDGRGNVSLRRSFSASIAPGASTSRSVACRKDLNLEVVLKSGKKS